MRMIRKWTLNRYCYCFRGYDCDFCPNLHDYDGADDEKDEDDGANDSRMIDDDDDYSKEQKIF